MNLALELELESNFGSIEAARPYDEPIKMDADAAATRDIFCSLRLTIIQPALYDKLLFS